MVIKTLSDSQNPFSDYGMVVVEERFVGRKDEIIAIQNRVLGKNYGNLSVVGLPRIGKSSLVWNTLMLHKQALLDDRKIIVQFISMGKLTSALSLYEIIMKKPLALLEK